MRTLAKFVHLLEHLSKHISYNSYCLEQVVEKQNYLAGIFGEPNGRVTFGGAVRIDGRKLKEAFNQRQQFRAENVQMDFEFSQALFMSTKPELQDRLSKVFEDSQVEYAKDLLEQHVRLDDLITKANEQTDELKERASEIKELLNIDIRSMISNETKEEKARLRKEIEAFKGERKKMDAGLRKIDKALKDAEAAKVEASNVLAANKPQPQRIKTFRG